MVSVAGMNLLLFVSTLALVVAASSSVAKQDGGEESKRNNDAADGHQRDQQQVHRKTTVIADDWSDCEPSATTEHYYYAADVTLMAKSWMDRPFCSTSEFRDIGDFLDAEFDLWINQDGNLDDIQLSTSLCGSRRVLLLDHEEENDEEEKSKDDEFLSSTSNNRNLRAIAAVRNLLYSGYTSTVQNWSGGGRCRFCSKDNNDANHRARRSLWYYSDMWDWGHNSDSTGLLGGGSGSWSGLTGSSSTGTPGSSMTASTTTSGNAYASFSASATTTGVDGEDSSTSGNVHSAGESEASFQSHATSESVSTSSSATGDYAISSATASNADETSTSWSSSFADCVPTVEDQLTAHLTALLINTYVVGDSNSCLYQKDVAVDVKLSQASSLPAGTGMCN